MPISRIAIFSGISPKQRKQRKRFSECTRKCRKDAPASNSYGPCLRTCLSPTRSSKPKRSRRK